MVHLSVPSRCTPTLHICTNDLLRNCFQVMGWNWEIRQALDLIGMAPLQLSVHFRDCLHSRQGTRCSNMNYSLLGSTVQREDGRYNFQASPPFFCGCMQAWNPLQSSESFLRSCPLKPPAAAHGAKAPWRTRVPVMSPHGAGRGLLMIWLHSCIWNLCSVSWHVDRLASVRR